LKVKFDVDKFRGIKEKKHGKGTLYLSNEDKYIGEYVMDKREGNGTYFWSDGSKWEGHFSNSLMNGKGMYTDSTGSDSYEVEYVSGQLKQD